MIEKIGVVHGRFQILHLKHMEYILAAKMRCEKLYIGISNPDSLHTKDSENDTKRSEKASNPLTYFDRMQMVRGAMKEFGVSESDYDVIPFPINTPEYILNYAPKDATYYMTIYDAWGDEKLKILEDLGLKVEVLWRKEPAEKGITSTQIRQCIALDKDWSNLVPKSVYQYLTERELDAHIGRLERMRIDEKKI